MSFFSNRRARSISSAGCLLLAMLFCGCDDSSSSGSRDAGLDGGELDGGDDGGGNAGNGDRETGEDCSGPEDCLPTLDCIEGICQTTGCTTGLEGCACADGELCTTDSSGNALSCTDGICMSPDCSAAGETSCPCINNVECITAEDVCENGFCVPGDCVAGAEGCECLAGGCDPGLFCKDSAICIDGTGYEGGACLPDKDCYLGNYCDELLDICVHCDIGSEGCHCAQGTNSCDTDLSCWEGRCESLEELPPTDPKCYTPCQDDLDTGNGIVSCDSDGLLSGCIDELSCLNGSCVVTGEAKPVCKNEVDCPFFQTCLQGGCYSNCETDTECSGGKGCYKKVCRAPCQSVTGGATCDVGSFCESQNGESGFCIGLRSSRTDSDVDGGAPPQTGFTLSKEGFDFSSIKTSGTLDVIGNSEWPQNLTIRKLSHTLTKSDGTTETVEAELDESTGEVLECDAVAGECPLWWLTISQDATSTTGQQLSFKVMPDCEDTTTCPQVGFSDAAGVDAVKWEGVLEIVAPEAPSIKVYLYYTEVPDGQWNGKMHYYGNFSENGIPEWLGSGDTSEIDNGLLKRWLAFRGGSMTGGWHEMKAVLSSTETSSWKFGEVAKRCTQDASLPDGACYPYVNTMGIKPYVQDLSVSPIPSAAVEYPVAFNLRRDPSENTKLSGRIETKVGMHYSANPSIVIEFEEDPTAPDSCDSALSTDCFVGLSSLHSEIVVGGRYVLPIGETCDEGYVSKEAPWLIPGFTANTEVSPETGYRYRHVCLDDEIPYDTTVDTNLKDLNLALSEANPVPDGTQRKRTLELLDGGLINQSELFIIFKETFESFIMYADEPEVTTAYGYMILRKQPADLGDMDDNANNIPDAFEGSTPPALSDKGGDKLGVSCDQQLVDDMKIGVAGDGVIDFDGYQITKLVNTMILGNQVDAGWSPLDSDRTSSGVVIHYLCEDTGAFNGGKGDLGGPDDTLIHCPGGSKVTFFVVKDSSDLSTSDIASADCQKNVVCEERPCDDWDGGMCENSFICSGGTCLDTLGLWKNNGLVETWEPFWKCDELNENKIYCDENRLDLRDGKEFYAPPEPSSDRILLPLQPEIENAFRYKTRFRSRSGSQVGFSPEICIPDSDKIPYCYDPPAIEEIRNRIDCLLSVYSLPDYETAFAEDLVNGPEAKTDLEHFLRGGFSEFKVYNEEPTPEIIDVRDGFERLYSELLIMQGDEALTAAFASRFDLAGVGGATFEGSKLETGGIDLSSVAGFEMYRLYQSVQYYQMALDRLYKAGPNISTALDRHHPSKPGGSGTDSAANFISPETVVLYFDRLIGASTQKARAWSEIAKRYQNFNRPDLSRSVIERAYTSTYLEGAILSNLMWDIDAQSTTSKRAQIVKTIEDGQLRYRMAMLKMQDLHSSITDDVNYFGLAPGYIPFPALDPGAPLDVNGFEVLLGVTQEKTAMARAREDLAISSNRNYNTDAAAFQSELAHIRLSYEDILSSLCGVFTGLDGKVYPAIKKYASQDTYATLLGDPCGLMGNGEISSAMGEWEDSLYAQMLVAQQAEHNLKLMDIERERIAGLCGVSLDKVNLQIKVADEIYDIKRTAMIVGGVIKGVMKGIMGGLEAVGADNKADRISAIARGVVEIAGEAGILTNELLHEDKIHALETEAAKAIQAVECSAFHVDERANLQKLWLQMEKSSLQAIRAMHATQLLAADVGRLGLEAKRIQDQQKETEQLSINIEAARNDPNVRIYKNDAIINADVAFDDSMRAAYRATRMFEYYTSQTYAYKDQLFLIRMVGSGEYNLENYLMDLENEFYEFEEEYGIPDLRVQVLSLRDDIMGIPNLSEDGAALSQAERIDLMRDRLKDVNYLDTNGYLNIPFSTALSKMSPLTCNHKVRYIETDIVGSDVGDTVGRVYIRQIGTGVIQNIYNETDYYVFPERTAVINPFFNGNRVFEPTVYQNGRLRDLPMVNTAWQMIFNQRDEEANKDVNLQSLSDIRCYVYYTDFPLP